MKPLLSSKDIARILRTTPNVAKSIMLEAHQLPLDLGTGRCRGYRWTSEQLERVVGAAQPKVRQSSQKSSGFFFRHKTRSPWNLIDEKGQTCLVVGMAIRKKTRKTGRTAYQVYWQNPYTRKQESREFEIEKDAVKYNDSILFRLKYERDSFLSETDPTVITVDGLLAMYMGKAPMTESTRKTSWYKAKQICGVLGDRLVTSLTRKDFIALEDTLLAAGQKQNTVNRTMSILTAAINWAIRREAVVDYDIPKYSCRRGPDEQLQPPTVDEVSRIISNAAPHVQRSVILAWHLGVRVGPSELFKVAWSGVDWIEQTIYFEAAKKNQKVAWRKLNLSPTFFLHLQEWHEDDNALAVMPTTIVHYRGKPVQSIKRAWKATLTRAGITRRIRPYDLRHAFATQALANGADIKAVSEIMGHANATMVLQNYQHVIGKQKEQAVGLIPEILTEQ